MKIASTTAILRKLSTLIAGLVALGFTSSLRATPYTVDLNGGGPSYGFIEYLHVYTPGSGWAQSNVGGNEAEAYASILVQTDDPTAGPTVSLKLTFGITFETYFINSDWYDPVGNGPEWSANFAGISGGKITANINTELGEVPISGSMNEYREVSQIYTYPVGPTPAPYVGSWSFFYEIDRTPYLSFEGFDPQVFDPTKPAAYAVKADIMLSVIRAEVVPDHGSVGLLLPVALGPLLLLGWRRRHRGKKALIQAIPPARRL